MVKQTGILIHQILFSGKEDEPMIHSSRDDYRIVIQRTLCMTNPVLWVTHKIHEIKEVENR
jgi:hypothetical protein